MTEQEINNLIDSKIGKVKMSQLPETDKTVGLYSIGYIGNQSVKYKSNLLQGDPLTVRKTYQTEVAALADKNPIDTTTSLPLKVGQFVSIVDDGEKNGIYRIGSISGDGTMSLELQGKLGDLSGYGKKINVEGNSAMVDFIYNQEDVTILELKDLVNDGYIKAGDGSVVVNNEYKHSNYISITPKTTIRITDFRGSIAGIKCAFYNNDYEILLSDSIVTSEVNFYAIAPSEAKYVRFCAATTSVNPVASITPKLNGENSLFEVKTLDPKTVNRIRLLEKSIYGLHVYGNVDDSKSYSINVLRNTSTLLQIRLWNSDGEEVSNYAISQTQRIKGVHFIPIPPIYGSGIYADILINFDYIDDSSSYADVADNSWELTDLAFNRNSLNNVLHLFKDVEEIEILNSKILKNIYDVEDGKNSLEFFGSQFEIKGSYIQASNSNINTNDDYYLSDFKEILPNKSFSCFNFHGTASAIKVSFYDKYKAIIADSNIITLSTSFDVISPSNASYVRFCYQAKNGSEILPEAEVRGSSIFYGDSILGKYIPINQINYNHSLTASRDFPWDMVAFRTFVEKPKVIANIIKVPVWTSTPDETINEYRLMVADSITNYNIDSMIDITDRVESVHWANDIGEQTILKIKDTVVFKGNEVIVFAVKRNGSYSISGNTNGDDNNDNKLNFLLSQTGQTEWGQTLNVSTGDDNRTPAMVLLMDEKFKIDEKKDTQWRARKTNVIATTKDFEVLENAVKDNQGFILTGDGTFKKNLQLDVNTYIERFNFTVAIKIESLSSGLLSFTIGKIDGNTYSLLRLTNNSLKFIYSYSGNIVEYLSLPITPISVNVGSELILSVKKTPKSTMYELSDGVNVVSETVLTADGELMNLFWGYPFIGTTNGTVFVKNISFSSSYDPIYSKIGLWGDSFFEGSSMISPGLENRYCAKLADAVGVLHCPIFGKGGRRLEESFWEQFKKENDWFRPKYVFIGLGTNNFYIGDYREYVGKLVSYVKDLGQIPILVTTTPRPNNEDFIAEANLYIRGLGERYVDMHKAVTVEGQPNAWKEGYVFGDGTHPTVLGHKAMFERIKIDVPELFEL